MSTINNNNDKSGSLSDILIKVGEEAAAQTGLPDAVVKILAKLSKYHPISIRGTPLTKSPNQRYNERFYPKPTAIHQKSSSKPPGVGHITEQEELSRAGLDLTDHTFGNLPENCKFLSAKELSESVFSFDSHSETMPGARIIKDSISTIDGRVCYQTETPHFKKIKEELPSDATIIEYGSKAYSEAVKNGIDDSVVILYKGSRYKIDSHESVAKKTYIQETEYLSDVMERIRLGEYEISGFDEKTGILQYRYPEAQRSGFKGAFEISLHKSAILHPEGDKGLWEAPEPKYPVKQEISIPDSNMQKLKKFIKQNPDVIYNAYGVSTISATGKRLPLMVQAGENGYPVTGDLDSMHFTMHGDLKIQGLELALETVNTYTDEGKSVFEAKIRELRDKLTKEPFSSRPELDIFQVFKEQQVPDPDNFGKMKNYDPLDEYLTPENIKALGKLTLGSFLFNCAANKELQTPMFQHGEESFNPGNSESFDANYFFYKEKVYHIDNERSYLAFLFHDYDYVSNHYVNIHKGCFRERPPGEKDITEMWIDLVRFQVVIGGFGGQIKKEKIDKEYDNFVKLFNQNSENINNQKPYFSDLEKIREQKNIKKMGEEIKKIDEIYEAHGARTRSMLPVTDTFEEMAKIDKNKKEKTRIYDAFKKLPKISIGKVDFSRPLILSRNLGTKVLPSAEQPKLEPASPSSKKNNASTKNNKM